MNCHIILNITEAAAAMYRMGVYRIIAIMKLLKNLFISLLAKVIKILNIIAISLLKKYN